ncbi:EamA/RhaT family transporter [Methanocella sp. CWC-04]|uniref:EamA/RhaT family transporter n=2 Tax=Methanooceanicella nereidis TaxID=2052831 RepID=A0AAP2RDU6_9EURY|nr:EamA/RhaT family transporter [Methanocella sp. CWC-04]
MDIKNENNNYDVLMIIALVSINIFWGASFIANAIALKSINSIELASIRFFIAAPVLAIVSYFLKGKEIFKIDKKDYMTFILLAITGVTVQYILQVSAQNYTTATNCSLLINSSVFFIMILSTMLLDEKMTLRKLSGAIIGFLGVALLVSKGEMAFDLGGHLLGDILIIICAAMWAVYSISGKKISSKYHPLTILNYTFILGTIGLVPFYFMTPHMNIMEIPMDAIAAILFLALFCSIVAYIVYNTALEKIGASRVALYIYLVPLSTIIMAMIVLNETMTVLSGIGGLLVLTGMYIAEKK